MSKDELWVEFVKAYIRGKIHNPPQVSDTTRQNNAAIDFADTMLEAYCTRFVDTTN